MFQNWFSLFNITVFDLVQKRWLRASKFSIANLKRWLSVVCAASGGVPKVVRGVKWWREGYVESNGEKEGGGYAELP